jgi:methionine--tRNA ligase beta chain
LEVSLEEFEKLDLRVVKVLKAERIPGLSRVLKLVVDVGGEVREMVVGGAQFYSPDFFNGRLFVAVVNLQAKQIGGVTSRGMLLAADLKGRPVWLTVTEEVLPGTKVR